MLANKNNLRSELTSNVSSSATTINITSGEGILRENNMVACLEHYEGEICTKREIIKITAKNSDSFTVSRGFAVCIMNDQTKAQGNTPQSFSTGDFLSLYFSKELRESITTGCVNNANAIAQMSEHITTIKNCIDGCCNNRIAKVGCLNDSHFTNGGFGNASDGDCVVEAGNHFREANKVYNFRNLTICEGACIRFEGEGVPQIKVYDHYINNGVIDTRAGYKKTCACGKQICFGKNCCASGKNSDNNCIVPGMFGIGGCGCDSGATIHGCSGCCASGEMGGYGGKGGDGYVAGNVCNPGGAGGANDGCNGGTGGYGGSGPGASCGYGGTGGGGGGGGGAGRFGNGGDGGHGGTGGGNYNYRTRPGGNGGVGGNSGLWGRGGNGGVGGTNGPSEIGGVGGNGGCGYIGGNGGKGGNTAWQTDWNGTPGGVGGNGGCGVICGGNGGDSGCGNCASCNTHRGGNGGNALTNIYGLIMNVRCASGTGCIRACGGVGGNGGTTPGGYRFAGYGGNGGNGANGGQVIYAYMHGTPETICVNGGAGGCGGSGNGYCDGQPGTAGTDGRKLVYMVSTDLDLARFIATQDEEYLLRLLSSESGIEAVAGSTEALRIIANDTELLSDVLSYTTIVNALISDSTCLGYIAGSHTSMVLVKDNTTIMNALVVDSTALGAISQQDFFDYVLENETFLSTCVGSTAGANKVNSIDADDLLEPIYFYTGDLGYDSWTTLSEDDTAMETLENNANAMLIIESNDECMEYFGNIPSEYQEVEYIQSSGTQYINTGIVPSNTTGIYMKLSSQNVSSDNVYSGSATNNQDSGIKFGIGNASNVIYFGRNNWNDQSTRPSTSNNVITELELNYMNSRYAKKDGTNIISLGTLSNIGYSINVFGHNGGGTAQYFSSIKLYSMMISDGTQLVRDFIPCYRKSDGVIGLYDKVSKTFFTNAGSGSFLKGLDKMAISKVQEVEYINSTYSGNQKISTGYSANSSMRFVVECSAMGTIQGEQDVVWGNSNTVWNWNGPLCYFAGTDGAELTWGAANGRVYGPCSRNQKHTIDFNCSRIIVDGSSKTGNTGPGSGELTLFYGNGRGGKMMIYSFKIYTGEALERDFIPCYRKDDSTIGLYDKVHETFYPNTGSGTFEKGGDIN